MKKMFKIILVLFILYFIFWINILKSQDKKFYYGLKMGLSVPAMIHSGTDPFTDKEIKLSDYKYKYSQTPFYGGIFGEYKIKNRSIIQANIYFINTGFNIQKKVSYEGLVEAATDINLKFSPEMIFDLMYKHTFFNKKFNVLGGIYFSKMFQSEMTTNTPLIFPEVNIIVKNVQQKANLGTNDFGITLVVEYFISKHFFIELKTQFGLIDIAKNPLLKITPESLLITEPQFAKQNSYENTPEQNELVARLVKLSDKNGKYLRNLNMYKQFTQVGIGLRL